MLIVFRILERRKGKTSKIIELLNSTKIQSKRRKITKKQKEDIYSVKNMVFVETRGKKCCPNIDEKPKMLNQVQNSQIFVPEFKVLGQEFYNEKNESDPVEKIEYEEIHRKYELSESCNSFLGSGSDTPDLFKDGLVVKIILPKIGELPSIIL